MAKSRMFALTIIDSDPFLDFPPTTQNLYFHLAMRADDDGIINSPNKIIKFTESTKEDLNLLVDERFLIKFESGVIIIKHWLIHNNIQKDRYKPTLYQEEFKTLKIKDNKSYTEIEKPCIQNVNKMLTECVQNVNKMDTQVRLGKVSLDEFILYKISKEKKRKEKKKELKQDLSIIEQDEPKKTIIQIAPGDEKELLKTQQSFENKQDKPKQKTLTDFEIKMALEVEEYKLYKLEQAGKQKRKGTENSAK